MSKSVYVVGGIGAMGCVMLSLMMQHALKVKTDRGRSPVAAEIETECSDYLTGPVDVSSRLDEGEPTMFVVLTAQPSVDGRQLARTIADIVWRNSYRLSEPPDRLEIEVRSAGVGQAPATLTARPPGLRRPRLSSPDAQGGRTGAGGATPPKPAK